MACWQACSDLEIDVQGLKRVVGLLFRGRKELMLCGFFWLPQAHSTIQAWRLADAMTKT